MDGDGDVEYEPVSVKEVLGEMKDTAELLVDLSYSSVLFENAELAEEVLELESRMDVLQLQAWMSLVMAGRSPREAEELAPIFGIVGAAEKISDAAADVAKVVLEEMGVPPALAASLPDAVETLARATVAADSPYADRTLGAIDLETGTGVRIIAVRRGDDWVLDPDRDTRLRPDDVALCRGPEERVAEVVETLSGTALERPEPTPSSIGDLDRAVESVVLMKNMSELAVDLAYGSVIFDSPALAEEVRELEVEVDALKSRLEAWALRAAAVVDDPISIRGLLHIAASTEVISDAALEISEGVLRGLGSHPVVAAAVEEADERLVRVAVSAGGELDGVTVEDVRLRTSTGVQVVAIRRAADETADETVDETAGRPAGEVADEPAHETADGTRDETAGGTDWIVSPAAGTTLRAGDVLIAKGTGTGTDRLAELAG